MNVIDRGSRGGFHLTLVALLFVGSMVIRPGGGTAPVDILMAIVAAHTLIGLLLGTLPIDRALSCRLKAAGWTVAVFLGVATASVALLDGSIEQLVTDAASFLYLFVPLALLLRVKASMQFNRLIAMISVAGILSAGVAIADDSLRASGLMANPNMAGAWLGLAIIVAFSSSLSPNRLLRIMAIASMTIALVATDSYSAMLGLALAAVYYIYTGRQFVLAAALSSLVSVIIYLLWERLLSVVESAGRLESSRGSRTLIWEVAWDTWLQHPFGIGHGNFAADRVFGGIQTHNDYLGALVENGPVGLLALLSVGLTMWLAGGRTTRCVLIFIAFNALFHNVLNFRHIWLFAALALVIDYRARRLVQSSSATDDQETSSAVQNHGHSVAPS